MTSNLWSEIIDLNKRRHMAWARIEQLQALKADVAKMQDKFASNKNVENQEKAQKRHKEKLKNVHFTNEIRDHVVEYLGRDYSPEQIVGRSAILEVDCVSVERIYQFIWANKKKGGELFKHLRSRGKRYQSRGNTNNKRGNIPGKVHISQRPAIVDEKKRFGDLEVDLIIGKRP